MVGVGVRYYTQSEAEFYSSRKDYFTNQKYASSDKAGKVIFDLPIETLLKPLSWEGTL